MGRKKHFKTSLLKLLQHKDSKEMGFSIIKIYAKTVNYSGCGWRLIAFFFLYKEGYANQTAKLEAVWSFNCANSSVDFFWPNLCLSVEILFRVISQREMEELEMTMDQAGTSARQTIKTLLVQKHFLEIENLTLNSLFYCSSWNCKIGKYSILSQHP